MEDSNDVYMWFLFFLVYCMSIMVAYNYGKKVEEKFWKNEIPAAMTKLCVQCYNAGR